MKIYRYSITICPGHHGFSWSLPVRSSKVRYADIISKNGMYLGLADVALLAYHRKQCLCLLVLDDDPEPKYLEIADILECWVGKDCLDALQFREHCSAGMWDMVFCKFDFQLGPLPTLNHFLPAWTPDHLGKERFKLAYEIEIGKVSRFRLEVQKMLNEA